MQIDLIKQKPVAIIVNEDGSVSYEVEDRQQPLEIDHDQLHKDLWRSVRIQRDRLLAECDWIVARAYERGEQVAPEWITYRQALRDITRQGNPSFITWPQKPA